MRTDRLLKLANFLDTLEPERLRMDQWTCGTAACAIGWYCQKLSPAVLFLAPSAVHPGGVCPVSIASGQNCTVAIAEEFEMSATQAAYLFCHSELYRALPATVAARIRDFVGAVPTLFEMKPVVARPLVHAGE